MTVRVRVLESVPGRWVASVDACSLPLAAKMIEIVEFTPLEGSGTMLRFRVGYDVIPAMKPLHPLIKPVFDRLFQKAIESFAVFAESHTKSEAEPSTKRTAESTKHSSTVGF